MQEVLIATTCSSQFENASAHIKNKSLLYDKDKDRLYIKYNDEMHLIGSKVDNDNIVLNDDGQISLADDVHCKTLTVAPDNSGIVYKDNVIYAETTENKRIVLLFKLNSEETVGTIGGKFYENGDFTSGVNFSASVSGSRHIDGSSTGEVPTWCRCTYHGIDYLGLRFNSSTKIYFSGYEYIKEAYKVDFDYTDSEFDAVVFLTDDANKNTNTIVINNPNSTTWDFTGYVEGLSDIKNETEPNTEYDLKDGLIINKDFGGTVFFYPGTLVKNDVGYITVSGQGKALKIRTNKIEPKLKVYFSSNSSTDEPRTLQIWDDSDNVVASNQSRSNISISVLKFNDMERNKDYFIGSENSRIRIHKIVLSYSSKEVVQEGWSSFNYTWEFNSTPNGWSGSKNYDWGNGLLYYYMGNGTASMHTTDYAQVRATGQWNQGYIQTPVKGGGDYIFAIDVPNDKTTLSCLFTTARNGGYRTLSLVDSNGETLIQVGNVSSQNVANNQANSLVSTLSQSNLSKGTYYLWASAELKIWQINLQNAGQQEIIGGGDDSNTVEKTVETIEGLEETGEDGDSHYINVQDQVLTMADLQDIAVKLRNSDKQVHLNLSECTVAEDATEWTRLFENCTSLTYLAMPQGVTKIGVGTFVGCMFLKKIEISDTVSEFNSSSNQYIFSGARTRTIILPKNCSKLGWNTFANSAVRNIVVKPDSINNFYSMLEYGTFFNTLNYIRIYMTQEEYNKHNWSLSWEHDNFVGSGCVNSTLADHIVIYDNFDTLLEELGYEEEII